MLFVYRLYFTRKPYTATSNYNMLYIFYEISMQLSPCVQYGLLTECCCSRGRYHKQGQVITSRRYCPCYLLMAQHSSIYNAIKRPGSICKHYFALCLSYPCLQNIFHYEKNIFTFAWSLLPVNDLSINRLLPIKLGSQFIAARKFVCRFGRIIHQCVYKAWFGFA